MKEKLKFLQIDTSNEEYLFLKLYLEGVESHIYLKEKRCHLKKLIPSIQEILNTNNFKISDLDFIALNEGPGSWTGLRIGFSTVKILSQVNNIKIITYSNFDKLLDLSKNSSGVLLVKSSNENFYYQVWSEGSMIEQGIIPNNKISDLYPSLNKYYQDENDFNYNKILIKDYNEQRFADVKNLEAYYIVEGVVFNKFE